MQVLVITPHQLEDLKFGHRLVHAGKKVRHAVKVATPYVKKAAPYIKKAAPYVLKAAELAALQDLEEQAQLQELCL